MYKSISKWFLKKFKKFNYGQEDFSAYVLGKLKESKFLKLTLDKVS